MMLTLNGWDGVNSDSTTNVPQQNYCGLRGGGNKVGKNLKNGFHKPGNAF